MDNESDNLGDIFDTHLEFEFDKEDVDATMTTVTEDPYVHRVPTLMGGRYYDHCKGNYTRQQSLTTHLLSFVPQDVLRYSLNEGML
jgi:hypothetical protein